MLYEVFAEHSHANIDVTQNVYGKSWWEERVDAVTRAVEAVPARKQRKLKRISLNPSTMNGCPCGCPSRKQRLEVVEGIDRP
jgi:hypothetical protein